jgi:hypothetical protein
MESVKICFIVCLSLPILAQGAPNKTQDISQNGSLKGSDLIWYDGLPSPTIFSFGCDFPSDDIERMSIVAELCGQACRKNDKCTHFVHNKAYSTEGLCFLKRRAGVNFTNVLRTAFTLIDPKLVKRQ